MTPRRLDLKLGYTCNNRCTFCVQGDRRAREPDLDTAEVIARLAVARAHASEVVLTGGEIGLRRDLATIVRAARGLGYDTVQVQSNGRVFARPERCDELVAAGVTEFGPSLHGATAATHEAQTRSPGSWRQTVKGIQNLVDRRQMVIVNSVVTRQNLHELPALGQLLVHLGVEQYQLAMVHPLGTAATHFDAVVPRLDDAAPWVRAGLLPGLRAGRRVMVEAMPPCFMVGWEAALSEAYIPPTRIVDGAQVVVDYRAARVDEGKAKGPPCARCTWDNRCEGPWREYPGRHGWDGYVPRVDTPSGTIPPVPNTRA